MNDDSPPQQRSATQQTVRGIILAVIVGVLIFNWWSERKRPKVVPVSETVRPERVEPTSDNVDLELSQPKDITDDQDPKTKGTAERTQKPDQPKPSPIPSVQKSNPPTTATASQTQPPVRGPPAVESKTKPADPRTTTSPTKPANQPTKPGQPRVDGLKVHDVVIRNQEDEVVYRGTVDLTQTLERIDDERILTEFRHDGIEFKNFERRLPIKSRGHYREWVHPTKGQRGPGPQRVISGKDGEAYYTWDHYEHFVRLRSSQ